jgi:hypothetical protein
LPILFLTFLTIHQEPVPGFVPRKSSCIECGTVSKYRKKFWLDSAVHPLWSLQRSPLRFRRWMCPHSVYKRERICREQ